MIAKNVFPYACLAALLVWNINLQGKLSDLESTNSSLTSVVAEYAEMNRKTDAILLEWADERKAIFERRGALDAEIDRDADESWDAAGLPDSYIRVLREAGIYDGGCPTASVACPRSGTSKIDGND